METAIRHFILLSEAGGILVQVLNAVHALGNSDCIVVTTKKTRRIFLTNMTTRSIEADFCGSDDEYLVKGINQSARDLPGLTIIPCDCPAARLLDRIGQRLNAAVIPSPDAAMLNCFDDKWQFYQFCKMHGLSVPLTKLVASKHDLHFTELASEFGLPFVVKPLNEAGSLGVCVICSKLEFQKKILDSRQYQFSPLLIQKYICGTDVGLNLLAIHGKITAISIQKRDFPQNFSAPIEFISNDFLEQAASAICEKSGYHGVMNIDARIDEKTGLVFLFETNPRFWGSLSASTWCGLNFIQECLEPALPPAPVRRLHSGRASVHYHPMIQPALWGKALFSRHAHQRRMVRVMMGDLWTLLVQAGSLRQKVQGYLTAQREFLQIKLRRFNTDPEL